MSDKKRGAEELRSRRGLRERAVASLQGTHRNVGAMPPEDVRALVHELDVHQIELEIQNEELRQAQADLATSRDQYVDLFEFAPFGYLTLERNGQIVQANLTAAAMLAIDRGNLIGANIARFVAPDFQDACYLSREELFATGTKRSVDLAMRRSDGRAFVGRMESDVAPASTGGEARCRTALTDISELKDVEEQLRRLNEELEHRVAERTAELQQSENRIRSLLDAAADALLTVDQRGIMLQVNPAAEAIFGYRQDELLGQHASLLMPPPYYNEYADFLADYLRIAEPRQIGIGREATARRKDGTTIPVELTVNEVDRLGIFIATVRDVSHRKELERQVLAATSDEQRRIAQDLHDGIGQELTGLRYLSQNLLEMLESATAETDAPGTAAALARRVSEGIASAQKHLRGAIRGVMPVDVDAEGLGAALEELAARTNLYGDARCRFVCETPVPVEDNAVATQLYLIAREAVTNAVKHARAQVVQLRLNADAESLTLRVADDGVGIDSRPSSTEGWGLRIMAYRASLIGAELTVERRSTGGTVATCVLPIKREA